ncbi:hypothetical protein K469DRAFT_785317 [Zopfia rhizophila CBS 207.26]|uniref:Uncharacterized protein n=1 Tax=Zopfia rhizophila CBS 207.26 TaxID=1314779 RepID=A0A6A6DVQ3_9PEZI|nr:hypothetical protein K469DRAFT_785317 [Zopfia rhizophila CBS 207.26]
MEEMGQLLLPGEFLQGLGFKAALINTAVEKMVELDRFYELLAAVVYHCSTIDSPARKLAVNIAAHRWPSSDFRELKEAGTTFEFLKGVLVRLFETREDKESPRQLQELLNVKNICKYHEHTRLDKPCYKESDPTSSEE